MRSLVTRIIYSRFIRFLLSGGLNTLITYGIYLVLLQMMSYRLSYTIAYVAGIAILYLFNRWFVFRTHRGLRSMLLFPLVYVFQYGFGLFILWLWVDQAKFSETIGPLVVVVLSVPLTYLLTRIIFIERAPSTHEK